MTFAQRRNRLTTHFSERIPVVKRRVSVLNDTRRIELEELSVLQSTVVTVRTVHFDGKGLCICLNVLRTIPRVLYHH
jgi:hypothetical protein